MFYNHKNGISFRKINCHDLIKLCILKNESWFGTVNTVCINSADQKAWFETITGDASCLYLMATTKINHGTLDLGVHGNQGILDLGLYGITDINAINHSCSFTHSIFKEHRGKSFGRKTLQAGIDLTFEVFNMRRVDTWILDNNKAEMKVSQEVGFKIEGTARKAVYKQGDYLDCHYLGLLRDEWKATPRVVAYNGLCSL